jgi:hypothetical protein
MRRRRRLWLILLALPVVLLAAVTAYWRIAVGTLQDGFAAWAADRRAAGWTVGHAAPASGGWPLAATLSIPQLKLSGGDSNIPGGLAWSAETVVLRVALLRPGLLEVSTGGRQRLQIAGSPEVPYSADRLQLVLPSQTAGWPPEATLQADGLRVETPAGAAGVRSLQVQLELQPAAGSGEPVATLALRAATVSPPPGISRLLGPRIASLAADAALIGPVPAGHTPAERAVAWRDGGGSLEIRRLSVNWGPLDLTATATLALDEQLQPMGAGSTHVVGYAETLDALAAHGAISRSAATAAKAVLSLLAHSPDDGSPPDVEVPLTLQYRTLSMRQVPLVRLPELDWP